MIYDDDKIQELLIGEAFGTLEKDHAKILRELLMKRPELRAELEYWKETTNLLAFDAPLVEPSPEVRENLLEKIRLEKTASNEAKSITSAQNNKVLKSKIIQFKPKQTWSFAQKMFAVAASLLIAFLGFGLFTNWQNVQNLSSQVAELRQKLSQTQTDLEQSNVELAKSRELLTTNSTVISLAGLESAPNAKARLIFDQKTGKAILVFEGLPQAPNGKAYQLWVIADNKPLSGGIFKTDTNGKGELNSEIPLDGRKSNVFAVTLEPETGVPAPTGSMFLKS